jgi:hypothetical protein
MPKIKAKELGWFQQCLLLLGALSFEQFEPSEAVMEASIPLSFEMISCPYANRIQKQQTRMAERLILILDFFPI